MRETIARVRDILKIVAHPLKFEILTYLAQSNGAAITTTDVVTYLSKSQSYVAQQISILRNNELIETTRKGRNKFHTINQKTWNLVNAIAGLAEEE